MVMRTMRANIGVLKWMFVLLLVVFGVGLVLPGSSASRRDRAMAAALVDGEPVHGAEFSRRIAAVLERARQQSGGELTDGEARKLRKETLEDMISDELAAQHAEDLGLGLSPEEFRDMVLSDSSLKDKDGRFDAARYQQILQSQQGLSVDEAERGFMRSMLLNKVRGFWASQAVLTPAERMQAETRYDRQLMARAAVWELSRIQSGIKVPEDDQRVYYSQNKQRWVKPAQLQLRQILLRPDFGASTATAKAKAEALLAKLKAGADFKALASKENADEASRKNAGDLGWLSREDMRHPEVAAEVFGLKPGQLSQVVQSPEGFHILKVEGRKAGFEPTFESQRAEVLKELGRQRAQREADRKAGQALAELKAGKSLEEAAKAFGGSVISSSWFGHEDEKPFPSLGENPFIVQEAFETALGQPLKEVVSAEKASAVILVTAERPGPKAKDAEKAARRSQIASASGQRNKGEELYKAWIESLKAKAVIKDQSGVLASK